jgi:CelD/BcsL family acetyltransferase involved in cellulose biosynthesis
VPARQRRKQRRALAAAKRLGAVAIENDWPADAFLDLLFELHRERWERRGESGVLDDRRVQAFHRAALPGLQAAGVARTLALTIGGRPVAAYYGFAWGSRAYAYLGGFDPSFEEASPGALTIGAAIQAAANEGASEFHFLRGGESYKYAWGARDRVNRARVWTRRDV